MILIPTTAKLFTLRGVRVNSCCALKFVKATVRFYKAVSGIFLFIVISGFCSISNQLNHFICAFPATNRRLIRVYRQNCVLKEATAPTARADLLGGQNYIFVTYFSASTLHFITKNVP